MIIASTESASLLRPAGGGELLKLLQIALGHGLVAFTDEQLDAVLGALARVQRASRHPRLARTLCHNELVVDAVARFRREYLDLAVMLRGFLEGDEDLLQRPLVRPADEQTDIAASFLQTDECPGDCYVAPLHARGIHLRARNALDEINPLARPQALAGGRRELHEQALALADLTLRDLLVLLEIVELVEERAEATVGGRVYPHTEIVVVPLGVALAHVRRAPHGDVLRLAGFADQHYLDVHDLLGGGSVLDRARGAFVLLEGFLDGLDRSRVSVTTIRHELDRHATRVGANHCVGHRWEVKLVKRQLGSSSAWCTIEHLDDGVRDDVLLRLRPARVIEDPVRLGRGVGRLGGERGSRDHQCEAEGENDAEGEELAKEKSPRKPMEEGRHGILAFRPRAVGMGVYPSMQLSNFERRANFSARLIHQSFVPVNSQF